MPVQLLALVLGQRTVATAVVAGVQQLAQHCRLVLADHIEEDSLHQLGMGLGWVWVARIVQVGEKLWVLEGAVWVTGGKKGVKVVRQQLVK